MPISFITAIVDRNRISGGQANTPHRAVPERQANVPDAILFFRLGDFYEMFFEDAEIGARVLDIQLTSRSKDGVPLCGVPYHSAEPYIAKLLKAGHKVAICEQGGAASAGPGAQGLMPRQIVRVITPGTVGEETGADRRREEFPARGSRLMATASRSRRSTSRPANFS